MIVILGAMQVEVDNLIGDIEDVKVEESYGLKFHVGKLGKYEVAVARCGVGKVNAAICAQTAIMTYHPELIINTGVAGSMSNALEILDVVVATDAVEHDYDTTAFGEPLGSLTINGKLVRELPCDATWREKLLRAANEQGIHGVAARVATGDQFISEREVKQRIVENFGAMACEMEGGAIAQACCIAGVPCAILRAISDATDNAHKMEFTAFLERAVANTHKILLRALEVK